MFLDTTVFRDRGRDCEIKFVYLRSLFKVYSSRVCTYAGFFKENVRDPAGTQKFSVGTRRSIIGIFFL